MDGTIADLYNVGNWLTALRGENSASYEIAKPLVNFRQLVPLLNVEQIRKDWGNNGLPPEKILETLRQLL